MDQLFKKRMETLLGDESEDFFSSLDTPLYQGLRISPRKQEVLKTEDQLSFLEKPSPFARNAWYIHGQHGLRPEHLQGLYYLQEPSAGSAVEALCPEKDDLVLDLCAAPGSKSTQILDWLEDGFLLSNEIDPKRAQVLLSNMERMGAENFMVTSMNTSTLSSQLSDVFDKILVDAPCSGEGMMKKHSKAEEEWSIANVLLCSARQKDILREAWKMLRPGGELVYSTCTYAREENEENIAWALKNLEGCVQLDLPVSWGREGIPSQDMDASKVRRIFPMDGGEGHFVAKLKKDLPGERGKLPGIKSMKLPEAARRFVDEQSEQGYSSWQILNRKGVQQVYGMNHPFFNLKKGTVLRQGVLIGEIVKNRLEPAHAFYLTPTIARYGKTHTETTPEQMDAFYHGEQLNLQAPSGYRALSCRGIPYGFGKSSQSRITNKLPKGLRLLPGSHLEKREDDENE